MRGLGVRVGEDGLGRRNNALEYPGDNYKETKFDAL